MQIKHPALLACTIDQGMPPIGDNAENSMGTAACISTGDRASACTSLAEKLYVQQNASEIQMVPLHTGKHGILNRIRMKLL